MLEIPHAETNATLLPRTMAAMRRRAPEEIGALADALGTDPGKIQSRIQSLGGGRRRLRDLDADPDAPRDGAERDPLAPGPRQHPESPERAELEKLLERAW